MKQVTLKVEGMTCGHCANSVEGVLKKAGAHAEVNLLNKSVFIEYDETKLNLEKMKEAIINQGFDLPE